MMPLSLAPQCHSCRHWIGLAPSIGYTCAAFSDKAIPVDIVANATSHTREYPGDHGIRWEPRDATLPVTTADDADVPEQKDVAKLRELLAIWVRGDAAEAEAPAQTPSGAEEAEPVAAAVMATADAQSEDEPGGRARTDPPVSAAQRRAMGAAMSGKSNLGIPASVGREFIEEDPGGKLPERAKDDDAMPSSDPINTNIFASRIDALMKDCERLDARLDAYAGAGAGTGYPLSEEKLAKKRIQSDDDEWSEEAREAALRARQAKSKGSRKPEPNVKYYKQPFELGSGGQFNLHPKRGEWEKKPAPQSRRDDDSNPRGDKKRRRDGQIVR